MLLCCRWYGVHTACRRYEMLRTHGILAHMHALNPPLSIRARTHHPCTTVPPRCAAAPFHPPAGCGAHPAGSCLCGRCYGQLPGPWPCAAIKAGTVLRARARRCFTAEDGAHLHGFVARCPDEALPPRAPPRSGAPCWHHVHLRPPVCTAARRPFPGAPPDCATARARAHCIHAHRCAPHLLATNPAR